MEYMATVTIKNIPDEYISELKKKAKNHQRSLNGEIITAIRGYLARPDRRTAEDILRGARALRAKVRTGLSEQEIDEAIQSGRE
jgi:plasmid stability protein